MKRKLLSVLTTLAMCLSLLPTAALAWYPYCDCEEPVDVAPHDHYCDTCEGITYYLEDLTCCAEDCDAWETSVSGRYEELNYELRDGDILTSGRVSVQVKSYDPADPWNNQPPADGTVSITWDEDYTTGDVALDAEGKAVIEFVELPLIDLMIGGPMIYKPADSAKWLPSENGLSVQYAENLFRFNVCSDSSYTINGMEEDELYFLAGTEVTVQLKVSETAQGTCTWTFDEEENVPEYVADGVTMTFTMPAGDVYVSAEFDCDTCEDENEDHWCDNCVTQLSECVDEDNNHWCDLCWEFISGLCFDEELDHYCDVCAEYLVWLCFDEEADHVCDVCWRWLDELCYDESGDHICDVCQSTIDWMCYDEDADHFCDVPECSQRMSWCEDEDRNQVCDYCGSPVHPRASDLDVEAKAGDGCITVTWEAMPEKIGEDTLASYTVYCQAEEQIFEEALQVVYTPAEAPFTHTFTGLTNDESYEVGVVMTYTLVEEGYEEPYSANCGIMQVIPVAADATVPAVPTIVSTAYGDGTITVKWTAPESDGGAKIRGYCVEVGDESFAMIHQLPVEELGSGTMSFTVEDLPNGADYYISVAAYNVVGESAYAREEIRIPLIPYNIKVGGVAITEENMHDVLGDGTVSYEYIPQILTLNNANIEVLSGSYGIVTDVPLTIELVGENYIHCSGYYGLLARNALTICGDGELNVYGSDFGIYTTGYPQATLTVRDSAKVTAVSGDVVSGGSYGIRADGVFTVCGEAEVSAIAGSAPVRSCGIYAYTRLNVLEQGRVSALGGVAGNDSYGIRTTDITMNGAVLNALGGSAQFQNNGIYTQGFEILSGETYAQSGTAASGASIGLQVTKQLLVNGEDTHVLACGADAPGGSSSGLTVGDLMVVGGGHVTAIGGTGEHSHGMDLYELTVYDGTIVAQSGNSDSEEGFCWGIQTGLFFNLQGGSVTAVGGDGGWRSYGVQSAELMNIAGGTLNASSGSAEGSYALWSFGQPSLGEKMSIRAPYMGQLDNNDWYWTVSKMGKTATEVEIARRVVSSQGSSSSKPDSKPEDETESKPAQREDVDSYTDVAADAWYYEAVEYVLNKDVMNGLEKNTFAPDATMDRATLATVLWNLAGKPKAKGEMQFADVSADADYAQAVKWAASKGIVAGVGEDSFAPDAPLTREQLATILYAYEKANGGGFTGSWMFLLNYPDRADVAEWAYEPMCWMTMKGVISGKNGGVLDPKGIATRAEAAQMLMRYMQL